MEGPQWKVQECLKKRPEVRPNSMKRKLNASPLPPSFLLPAFLQVSVLASLPIRTLMPAIFFFFLHPRVLNSDDDQSSKLLKRFRLKRCRRESRTRFSNDGNAFDALLDNRRIRIAEPCTLHGKLVKPGQHRKYLKSAHSSCA